MNEEEAASSEAREQLSAKKAGSNYLSMGTKEQSSADLENEGQRTQVFSGSSDEWTDQRIREF